MSESVVSSPVRGSSQNSQTPLPAGSCLLFGRPLENKMTREGERERERERRVTQVNIYKSQARFYLLIFD